MEKAEETGGADIERSSKLQTDLLVPEKGTDSNRDRRRLREYS